VAVLQTVHNKKMLTNPTLVNVTAITGRTFIQYFIPNLIGLAFVVAIVILFFVLIMGAIQWINSGSDKQALEGARGRITGAITGIVILCSMYAVIGVINYIFCVNILSISIEGLRVIAPKPNNTVCPTMPWPPSGGGGGGGTVPGPTTGPGPGPTAGPGGTGNRLCPGCITGGCGITGHLYIGPGQSGLPNPCYLCTASGWQNQNTDCSSLGGQTCGTCN
jgi:hypothetical protein